jgi:hypothetical protein
MNDHPNHQRNSASAGADGSIRGQPVAVATSNYSDIRRSEKEIWRR